MPEPCKFLSLDSCLKRFLCIHEGEIKVPSVENTELEGSPFKALGRSVYSHSRYAAMDLFLANFYHSGLFTCIFSNTSPEFFLC